MTLLPLFEWFEGTYLGQTIRGSLWMFPVIESFHLVSFAVLGGTVLLVDLRLLGIAFRTQPVAHLAREAYPWLRLSLAVALFSGSLLFLSEPMKLYYNDPFWVKITCLLPAILFTFTVRRRVSFADEGRVGPFWKRLVAIVSVGLWGAVAWGGRWIGFSG
jgi:hypothetical protein